MNVKEAIQERRAYLSLANIEITQDLIKDLAISAQLAPSCLNSQPWRFIFVYGKPNIEKILPALNRRNRIWIKNASLIIAVFSRVNDDCVIKEREYYLFDTGLATGFIILRATELGLVAHPIAGFDEEKVKHILEIPDDMKLITLVNIGKKTEEINPDLSEPQKLGEKQRPPRKELGEFIYINKYSENFRDKEAQ